MPNDSLFSGRHMFQYTIEVRPYLGQHNKSRASVFAVSLEYTAFEQTWHPYDSQREPTSTDKNYQVLTSAEASSPDPHRVALILVQCSTHNLPT